MIHVGESSWNLRIYITDLDVEKKMRVRGDQHIGGLMLQLVDTEKPKDWSDHALWWPTKNIWLLRTRSTLDQVGLQADCILHFTPMHKTLRVQMPDLRYLDCSVDFSVKTFGAVVKLCKDLDIRHPEELSLCVPLQPMHLKKNFRKVDGTIYIQPASEPSNFIPFYSTDNNSSSNNGIVRPRSLVEKARMNVGWLDSSLSLMEQGVREFGTLCLRFKYFTFFDLN